MDKEVVVHIHNGIWLSHKRNTFDSVLTSWMSLEPIIQSEQVRERQILYTNAYIWNLERWYWWTYLLGGNGNTDIKNWLMDTVGEGEGGADESSTDIWHHHAWNVQPVGACTTAQGPQLRAPRWPRGVARGGLTMEGMWCTELIHTVAQQKTNTAS